MDWKNASMSGNLTWVKGTAASSPTHATLYSELSPTLIVGFTPHDGAPADYVKFSNVASVMHMAPHTVQLRLRGAAQLSLIAPDAAACLQWVDAINIALSGTQGGSASVGRVASAVVRQSPREQTVSTAGSGVAGFSAWKEPQRVLHPNDARSVSSGAHVTEHGESVPLNDATMSLENVGANRGVAVRRAHDTNPNTSQSMVNSLGFAHPPQSSMVHHGVPERTMLPQRAEDDTFLPPPERGFKEAAAVSRTTEPNLSRISSDVDTSSEMRKGAALFSGNLSQREKLPSASSNYTSQLKPPISTLGPSAVVPLRGMESRRPTVSMTSEDRCDMERGGSHTADLRPPEPPHGPLSFDKAGIELFGSRLPAKGEYSSHPEEVEARGEDKKLSRGDAALSAPHVDADARSNTVKQTVGVPSSKELQSANYAAPVSFQHGAATPAFGSGRFPERKPTHADAGVTRQAVLGATEVEEASGRDALAGPHSRQVNEFLPPPAWQSRGNARSPLKSKTPPETSGVDRPREGYRYHSNRTKSSTPQTTLAESIIDRIINVSPRSAPYAKSSPAVFSPGIDTPSVRLPLRERDGYYRPIEAAVAVIPRDSASGVRGVLGRSSGMKSDWPRNVTERCRASDLLPPKQWGAGPSIAPRYTELYRGRSPPTVHNDARERHTAMQSPAYRRPAEHTSYSAARSSSLSGVGVVRGGPTSPRSRRESFQGASSRDSGRVSRRKKLGRKRRGGALQPAALFLMEPRLFKKHTIQGRRGSEHYVCMTEDGACIVCIPAREFETQYARRQRRLASLEEVLCVYGDGCRAMELRSIDHVSLGMEEEWTHGLDLQVVGLDRLVCVVSRSHALLLEAATAAGANNFVEALNACLLEYA
ncbi:uncharacterized protein Tco025E_03865 [Trypanosoma conorhini]|uniref:PH domain-containing protein n=1 Tax=Trypanosoma conorhini TaxID=83891 RepID=A0A422PRA2_9TRYP|nr:uncharacterized protein Tco025E_03865 [Trypanosoma conorhini]RNF20265.1 hypothetical protein Tco025E_03865 [Trypanosoma conorhini]